MFLQNTKFHKFTLEKKLHGNKLYIFNRSISKTYTLLFHTKFIASTIINRLQNKPKLKNKTQHSKMISALILIRFTKIKLWITHVKKQILII